MPESGEEMVRKYGAAVKVFILLGAAALLAALWLGAVLDNTGQFLGVPVLDEGQWNQLRQECLDTEPFDGEALLWQGASAPYDIHMDMLLLSQNASHSRWEGTLTPAQEGIQLFFLENPDMGRKKYCVWENISFQLAVVRDGTWMQTNVLFSGLPVISLKGEADDTLAEFLLFDPRKQSGKGAVVSSSCRFHKRGSSSVNADDPSLRLTLTKKDGSQNKVNLLGIRDDEDWILNSFYADFSRLREKIAYDLWEDIANLEQKKVASSSVTYVEVIWNQEYRGLYGLMPRLDAKQLAMDDGLIYKMRTWGYAGEEQFANAIGTDSLYDENGALAVTLKYPKEKGTWEPLQAYYQYVMQDDPSLMAKEKLSVSVSNAIAHSLYGTFLQAQDNTWKNIYLAYYPDGQGGYTIYQSPWDVDMTMGICYEGTDEDLVTPRSLGTGTLIYQKLYEEDPKGIQALAEDKWQLWKRSGITANRLCRRIDDELDYLARSGVLIRDMQRWGCTDHVYSAELLKGWIRAQFDQMDAKYGK